MEIRVFLIQMLLWDLGLYLDPFGPEQQSRENNDWRITKIPVFEQITLSHIRPPP